MVIIIGMGTLYGFGIDNGCTCYRNVALFGNDNSKRRMSCSCIGMRIITGMLYVLIRIFEGIGHGNIIHFCYYNSNRSSGSGSWSN